ncbi:unnamed protein product [Arabidopsis thaliana]|jgi:hypothetical protein|uniref:At2g31560 n=2 Tax=Arabidopsis thaliana TaxID=3702 RepID=Q8VZ71_ARATH|nr:signal transducer/transcription protein, putative (DUF1685) [Arabidopsis thaliana]NP_850169.1 signal transducer/transcription protein, putative (DUF1685) [Arabidopsis thaliana]NP_973575.1 signal transducer/transcription protein, putative (DUF1685) [Arabidopsis thaliana]AAL38681.1 unknown protein [Arabidopsis thaliana]AAT85765.1 At2g31560 [Arabidopsis thaliana]AEC08560.1 signal transducer/transcription protein, putative (DUF1685) [Arabidopsis thaliana]AEC08561.1 signal transducer/transcript|eukprot:NP_001325346.1 signal transducer/transcription protein, putative (DUF1685) [Arabidopsis thaliana]
MACIHIESSHPPAWKTHSVQENKPANADDISNTTLPEHHDGGDGGIQETWAAIGDSGGRGGGYFAGESRKKLEKKKSQVLLEGYALDDQDDLTRAKSLTDDDLEELKGCLDLGFGFSYDEIPELCNTLPALELCYSMSQKFLDDKQQNHHKSQEEDDSSPPPTTTAPIANWKISSPGDDPDDVKARLKYWAQTVACTVRLCS